MQDRNRVELMFRIEIQKSYWIQGREDDPKDLCLHGDVVVRIGEEECSFQDATISGAGLFLLRSLTKDHIVDGIDHMVPCCGHEMFPNEAMDEVDIPGCTRGIDWSVIHGNGKIKLLTEAGNLIEVGLCDYAKAVLEFTDQVERAYQVATPKKPCDEYDMAGYRAFWNEWKRRKEQYKKENNL